MNKINHEIRIIFFPVNSSSLWSVSFVDKSSNVLSLK